MTRIQLSVFVDLDPVPGAFSTSDSVRDVILGTLNDRLGHYNPVVHLESENVTGSIKDLNKALSTILPEHAVDEDLEGQIVVYTNLVEVQQDGEKILRDRDELEQERRETRKVLIEQASHERMPDGSVWLRNVQIAWPNFSGRPNRYQDNGARTFGVLLPDEIAEIMESDGWNVRSTAREDTKFVLVSLNYKHRDLPYTEFFQSTPHAGTQSGELTIRLGEHNIHRLDKEDIAAVDVHLSPYKWAFHGQSGVKAFAIEGTAHLV